MKLKNALFILMILFIFSIVINGVNAEDNISNQIPENSNILNSVSSYNDYDTNIEYNKINNEKDTISSYDTNDKRTIYVNNSYSGSFEDGSQSNPYKTINSGIANSIANDNINIAIGTYKENNIQINHDLNIIAGDSNQTIIDGENSGTIFNINNSNVFISDLIFVKGNGGAISNINGNLTINNSLLFGNEGKNGGAINSIANNQNVSLIIINSVFYANKASNNGGGIYTGIDSSGFHSLNISNSEFYYNFAGFVGGAIYNHGSFSIDNSNLSNNFANNSAGAIFHKTGTTTVDNCNFTGNNVTYSGAAIYSYAEMNIFNSYFNNNKAIWFGGAITNDEGILNIKNSSFTNNKGNLGGGAIASNKGNVKINTTIFTNNTSISAGGAIVISGGFIDLLKCDFYNNQINRSSVHYGGAIYHQENNILNVNYCSFVNNTVNNVDNAIYSKEATTNIDYNWWGSNNNPSSYIMEYNENNNGEVINNNISPNYWIIMSINTNSTNISLNHPVNIGVYLNQAIDNNGTKYKLNQTVNSRNLSLYSNQGYFKYQNSTHTVNEFYQNSTLVNGEFQLEFIANSYIVNGSDRIAIVSVEINNQLLSISYLINSNVNESFIESNDSYFVYGIAKNFTACLKDGNGSPILGKEIKFILINELNETKTYWRTTNTEGLAKLEISLIPGNWKINSVFGGNNIYLGSSSLSSVIVQNRNNSFKTLMIANDLITIVKSGENFTAKLSDPSGNPIIGKEISLTLKNVLGETKTYWRTTNDEGIVKLPIYLSYPGSYFISSYFQGDNLYNESNNCTASVLITL